MGVLMIVRIVSCLVFLTSINTLAVESSLPAGITCLDANKKPIAQSSNEQVLMWKQTTQNQFQSRALVDGVVVAILPAPADGDHTKFAIDMDRNERTKGDQLELVFNNEFGDMSSLRIGSHVIACGDYITSNQDTARYRASTYGAILHWLHYNPGNRDGGKHAHGFVIIDNKMIGSNPASSWYDSFHDLAEVD
jgi:hypothetical protein